MRTPSAIDDQLRATAVRFGMHIGNTYPNIWEDDEMIRAGLGAKTGRRMGHISMNGPEGSIAAFDRLGVRRKVFVHMNNSNPVWRAGPERAAAEAAGWEIARDGMEVTP